MLLVVFWTLVIPPELQKTLCISQIPQSGFEVLPSIFSAAQPKHKLSKAVDGWITSSANTSAAAPGTGWKFPKSSGKIDAWQLLGEMWFTVTSQNHPDRGCTEQYRILASQWSNWKMVATVNNILQLLSSLYTSLHTQTQKPWYCFELRSQTWNHSCTS